MRRCLMVVLAAMSLAACGCSCPPPQNPTIVVPPGSSVVCPNGSPAVLSGGSYRC
jgi:uncharacterized Zn-binding protein involved in type VI secretion